MSKKYQTGIQKTVFEIIKQSKIMGLKYIKKEDIEKQIQTVFPELEPLKPKISQALYQLQRKTKFRRPRIKKCFDKNGVRLGWTVVDEEGLYDINHLPKIDDNEDE